MSDGFLVLKSANAKLGPKGSVATTYAPIRQSCPTSCPFQGEGCYAQSGPVAVHLKRLEAQCVDPAGDDMSPLAVAKKEAEAIREGALQLASKGQQKPLRLHTFGDCKTSQAAHAVSEACSVWPGPVWTYTHAWRDVPRAMWGNVSVLASVEDMYAAELALDQGYAPAIVVPEFRSTKAWKDNGLRVIPCPSQTQDDVTCVDCRLCWDDVGLKERKSVIAFAAHGSGKSRAKRALRVVK